MVNRIVPIPNKRSTRSRVSTPPDVPTGTRREADWGQPVFVRHPPVLHERYPQIHHTVPYPYRFKMDLGWLLVLILCAFGSMWTPLLLIAAFISAVRCLVWLAFRFPLTTWFFVAFFMALLGRRRRW